jgi:long-chain acyl-CoA synthetase
MSKKFKTRAGQLKPVQETVEYREFRSFIDGVTAKYKDQTCFIVKDKPANRKEKPTYRNISYRELRNHINWLGTGLMARGLGDKRIAIVGENSYPWALTYLTVLCGSGIVVPLDKGLPEEEALSSIQRSSSDAVVFDKKHLPLIKYLQENNACAKEYICMTPLEGFDSLQDIMDEGVREFQAGHTSFQNIMRDPDEMAELLFTSGTTSKSKAVMLSPHNLLFDVYAMIRCEDLREGDVNMNFLPYHHTFGSISVVTALQCGIVNVYCDGLRYIKQNLKEYNVTMFVGVPLLVEQMYKNILKGVRKQGKEASFQRGLKISRRLRRMHIDVRRRMFKDIIGELGNLRLIISGASPLDPAVARGFDDIGVQVIQGYGLTETSPVICAENYLNQRPGSVGKTMAGIEARIVNEGPDGVGELVVKGANVMLGYYNDPEENAKVLVHGWLRTGDLAYIDDDGFIWLTGRAKNVIVLKNGKNVYPEEIETLIDNLPYVKENIVIGQPRHHDGNNRDLALCAKIVYDPDYMKNVFHAETQEDIEAVIKKDLDKINEELPVYKQIYRLIATDKEMEKTTTGKVKRFREGAVRYDKPPKEQ